jgi:hypothetical protein
VRLSLTRAQSVTVKVAEFGSLPAMVEEADDEIVVLVVTIPPDRRLGRVRDRPATVYFNTPAGPHQLTGRVDADPAHPETLLMRRGAVRRVQRRAAVRVNASVPIKVTLVDDPGRCGRTTTLDVSSDGLRIHDCLRLELGTLIDLELGLDSIWTPVRARARVIRDAGNGEKGVRLEHLSLHDEARLVRYVTARERAVIQAHTGPWQRGIDARSRG